MYVLLTVRGLAVSGSPHMHCDANVPDDKIAPVRREWGSQKIRASAVGL